MRKTLKSILFAGALSVASLLGINSSCLDNDLIPTGTTTTTSSSTSTSETATAGTLSGKVKDILSETGISGATVYVGGKSSFTNENGDYSISNVPFNNYSASVSSFPDYYTGLENLSLSSDLSKDFELIPSSVNKEHFKKAFQSYNGATEVYSQVGVSQRITDSMCSTWKIYINNSPAQSSFASVTTEMINKFIRNIEGNDSRTGYQHLTSGKLNPTQTNERLQIGTDPPAFGAPGWTIIYWDDSIGGGAHYEYLNGDNIISNYMRVSTLAPEEVYKHELYQAIGARRDSNIRLSIINDPLSVTSILQEDINDMKINYKKTPGTKIFD